MIKIIIALLTLLYPVMVYFALSEFSIQLVSFTLLFLFLLRLCLLKKDSQNINKTNNLLGPSATKIVSLLVVMFLLFSFISNTDFGLLLYPVIINISLAIVFLLSLINPTPVIERLARLTQPNLPEYAVEYTRTVTKVWLVFFVINSLIAFYTALFTSLQTWTFYNGFIAYILMALLFSGEYIVRLRVKKINEN